LFDGTPTKPQTVGDLIGRAFRTYRANIPIFVQVLMWPTLVSIIGKVGVQWGLTEVARKEPAAIMIGLVAMVIGAIIAMISVFILTMRQLAFVRIVNGFAKDYKEAYAFVKTRLWNLLGLIIVGDLIAFWAMIIWAVVVVLAALLMKGGTFMIIISALGMLMSMLGMFATFIVYWLVGFICITLTSCEDVGIGKALGRGFNLTFRDFGRTFLFGFVLSLTVMMMQYPLSLPALLLSLFEVFRHGMSSDFSSDPTKVPLYLLVLTQAWESMVNMILWPVIFVAFGLFYYDLRMRQEGVDVEQKLTLLNQSAT
jgi:hypothetical protein